MATKRKTAPVPPHIDQEFIDTFNPHFQFEIMGKTFRARALAIGDFMALKTKFKDWVGFDISLLVAAYEFDALLEICWLGIKDLNPEIPTREHLKHMINVHTFQEWGRAWKEMGGVEEQAEEPTEQAEGTEAKNEESSETGDISSP